MIPSDYAVREKALDISHSFIVQAPAGSGKTELLTQRFLMLLSQAKHPEAIIAITFTKKAAAQMRERIMAALKLASSVKPIEPYKAKTWQLAKQVLEQDHKQQWHLQAMPYRLCIQTMDSLANTVCRKSPWLSQLSDKARITQQPKALYQQAVRQLYQCCQHDHRLKKALVPLLVHLDNRVERLQQLLVDLLAKRDQWLGYILGQGSESELKGALESGLDAIASEAISNVHAALANYSLQCTPLNLIDSLWELAWFSAKNFHPGQKTIEALSQCQDIKPRVEYLAQWQMLCPLLLTDKNQWRKGVNKRLGFAKNTPEKALITRYLKAFLPNDTLLKALVDLRQAPPLHYTPKQWQIIQSLMTLLPPLVRALKQVFQKTERLDFIEVNRVSNQLLEQGGGLDYPIEHLLIDEFQDTSVTQWGFIEHLIQNLHQKEGRSVFLVGDPMQSIYRFRQAEVGLFTQAQQQGIANLPLIPLMLKNNFRSEGALVNWFNQVFPQAFPRHNDVYSGAISYSPAIASLPDKEAKVVHYYPLWEASPELEAQAIAQKVQALQQEFPDDAMAILLRSRVQLRALFPALQALGIDYQALDIEPLSHQMPIRDLITLLCALRHLDDELSWYALLRSPFCGLLLEDLLAISQAANGRVLFSVLQQTHAINLSTDARQRLAPVVSVMQQALENKDSLPMSQWLKQTWQALHGDQCLENESEWQSVELFFQFLAEYEVQNPKWDQSLFEEALDKLYANTSHIDARLHVMTIHKAKGLEFDHVILPSLDYYPKSRGSDLLRFYERPRRDDQGHVSVDLIFAPIPSADETKEPLYQYCQQQEQQKLDYEMARLFYVAATRAKKTIHAFFRFSSQKTPHARSFLSYVWSECCSLSPPKSSQEFFDTDLGSDEDQRSKRLLKRLPLSMISSEPSLDLRSYALKPMNLEHDLALRQKQAIGVVLHEKLYQWSLIHVEDWLIDALAIRQRLSQWAIEPLLLSDFTNQIIQALEHVQQEARGLWILKSRPSARSEYKLVTLIEGQPQTVMLDRSFIDQGTRWIIDYKTATPKAGEAESAFLMGQKKVHCMQLEGYAKILSDMEKETLPVRLGLYFPISGLWCEWPYQEEGNHAC